MNRQTALSVVTGLIVGGVYGLSDFRRAQIYLERRMDKKVWASRKPEPNVVFCAISGAALGGLSAILFPFNLLMVIPYSMDIHANAREFERWVPDPSSWFEMDANARDPLYFS